MSGTRSLAAFLVAGLGVLAGCGSQSEPGGLGDIGGAVVGLVRSDEATQITATDAALRGFGKPLLKVVQPTIASSAVLGLVTTVGQDTTWFSADQKSLTLRRGLVVATRGIGNDLMSADPPDVRAGQGTVLRDHYYLSGDETTQALRFRCALTRQPAQTITVIGVAYAVDRVVETCAGHGAGQGLGFTNEYWIERSGVIRRSRQWGGPEIGFLEIDRVHD